MSKGSRNRTADMAQYGTNFDVIFGKKEQETQRDWGIGAPGVWGESYATTHLEAMRTENLMLREAMDEMPVAGPIFTGKITMPQQICGNCKHWQKPENDLYGEVPGCGTCKYVIQYWDATEWVEEHDNRQLKPEHAGQKAFANDGSSYCAELKTMPDFGCNQWGGK